MACEKSFSKLAVCWGGWGYCDSLWIFMDQLVACGRSFSELALCWGGWVVVILCGSSWIAWWLVKGICFQVSRVLGLL